MARGLGPDELRSLYERYAPVVHRRARVLLRKEADAWDAVQEVFERLLVSPDQFRREARPMTYVYRITTNVCLNMLRAQAVRGRGDESAVEEPSVGNERAEAVDLIRALVGRLDERELAIATLHFVDGLKQEEIADILGLSRKTINREVDEVRRKATELRDAPVRGEDHHG